MELLLKVFALCVITAAVASLLRRNEGELALLLVQPGAAVYADDLDVRQELRQVLQVLGDLLGQLTRGT